MVAEVTYNTAELVCVSSARLLEDGKVVFAGAGLPLLAALLAPKTHAKSLTILFQGGAIVPFVERGKLPPSTNEPRCPAQASIARCPTDFPPRHQPGLRDCGFLGGAQ